MRCLLTVRCHTMGSEWPETESSKWWEHHTIVLLCLLLVILPTIFMYCTHPSHKTRHTRSSDPQRWNKDNWSAMLAKQAKAKEAKKAAKEEATRLGTKRKVVVGRSTRKAAEDPLG